MTGPLLALLGCFLFSSAGYFKLFGVILQSSSPSVQTEGVTLAYVQWKPTTVPTVTVMRNIHPKH